MVEQLSFKVAQVEGPLDLILQLISKHKLNIYDIEIAELLKQYLDWIQTVQEQNMEVASEFLDMASRLVYIKSVSLLPKHEELEEQLKKELTGQLIEYTVCKQVAELLKSRFVGDDIFFRKPEPIRTEEPYSRKHKKQELLDAYLNAVGKNRNLPISQKTFEPLVARRMVSVNSKIVGILKRLYEQKQAGFLALFEESEDRSDIVATFLAVLELVKNKRISIDEEGKTVSLL